MFHFVYLFRVLLSFDTVNVEYRKTSNTRRVTRGRLLEVLRYCILVNVIEQMNKKTNKLLNNNLRQLGDLDPEPTSKSPNCLKNFEVFFHEKLFSFCTDRAFN